MSNQPARSSLLRVGSYNLMDGSGDRWAGQMDLLASLDLDILGVQEAKHWERQDYARLHATAAKLGMQALFAPSKSHGCHLVIFYRWPRVSCARFQPDISGGRFHHTASRAVLKVDGLALQVLHSHFHPFAPSARLKEAGWLTEYAAADALSLIIADLNTSGIGDPDPADWEQVAAHLHSRHRRMLADGSYGGTDRDAMHALMNAGFVDPPRHLGLTPPRTAGHWDSGENWDRRSDYVLVSPRLAPTIHDHLVVDTPITRALGDHLPPVTVLNLTHLDR
ncbi:endonuclease/exonuclease/phosphatase [Streptomyces anulatus]|uniref:endonuclease/exonuclease/phosphatase n=1 Tax=Streptomyces anulatus TaxID=1892 RepID=UPI00386F2AC0|nr:endonuclease/exonuclease/phosphatase family protein [Streptomyces anulatus]WSU87331.1 endonuclease/exonuclease/phosphatase family protein [Streptomyces anulatus]